MEDEAIDDQRIVDADRLARDLLSIAIDGQVGPEVRERTVGTPGRLEAEVLDQHVAGRPDRLHGRGLRLADEDRRLEPEGPGHGPADEEQDEPEVGQQRGHLEVAVPVAVGERRLVVGRGLDLESATAQHGRQRIVGDLDAGERGTLAETQVEEGRRLFDVHDAHAPPQPRRAVDGADRRCSR